MPMLGLAQKLCLNEHVVPLHRVTMDIADPHKLTQEGDTERQDLCLVDVSPNGPSYWLEKGFNLSTRWWRSNSSNLPLLAEIRDAIISGKPSGPQARMPRRPNIVVAVKVRGQVILVQNSHKKLQLALPHGKEESLLSWFLEQLIGEVEAFTRKKRHITPSESSGSSSSLSQCSSQTRKDKRGRKCDRREAKAIKQCLMIFRANKHCKHAYWCASRNSFRIKRKDGQLLEHRIESRRASLASAKQAGRVFPSGTSACPS